VADAVDDLDDLQRVGLPWRASATGIQRRCHHRCSWRPDRPRRSRIPLAPADIGVRLPSAAGGDPQQGHEPDRGAHRPSGTTVKHPLHAGGRALADHREPAGRQPHRSVVGRDLGHSDTLGHTASGVGRAAGRHRGHARPHPRATHRRCTYPAGPRFWLAWGPAF
jgi:hypothetical protein